MVEPRSGDLPAGFGLRSLMVVAHREAGRAGSRDVRAEHLLLALAVSGTPASRVMSDAGLGRDVVEAALRAEREHSLAAVGMPPVPVDRLRATASAGHPGWGASAREALLTGRRRAHATRRAAGGAHRARSGSMSELDLLYAILSAELGTVPRALALAGLDRRVLLHAVDRAAGEP